MNTKYAILLKIKIIILNKQSTCVVLTIHIDSQKQNSNEHTVFDYICLQIPVQEYRLGSENKSCLSKLNILKSKVFL